MIVKTTVLIDKDSYTRGVESKGIPLLIKEWRVFSSTVNFIPLLSTRMQIEKTTLSVVDYPLY